MQLILSDIILPRLGGFEMAQAVFIQKPFTPLELLEKLDEAISVDLKRT